MANHPQSNATLPRHVWAFKSMADYDAAIDEAYRHGFYRPVEEVLEGLEAKADREGVATLVLCPTATLEVRRQLGGYTYLRVWGEAWRPIRKRVSVLALMDEARRWEEVAS